MKRHLSARAIELLNLISAATEWEGDERPGAKLKRFFVPSVGCGLYGAGDAIILRSLGRKGFIRDMRCGEYSYAITEDGILELARVEEVHK